MRKNGSGLDAQVYRLLIFHRSETQLALRRQIATAETDEQHIQVASLLDLFVHEFSPQGVTGVAVLAESHLSIHTWPEYGYVAADVFTCGSTTKPEVAAEVLRIAFQATHADVRELQRSVMPTVLRQGGPQELANA